MNVELRCISCILNRGYLQIQEATDDRGLQFKTLSAILRFLAEEFKPTANPDYLGTKRDRLIRKITGNPDLYKQKKQLSNKKSLEVVPLAKSIISKETSPELGFRKACLVGICLWISKFISRGKTNDFELGLWSNWWSDCLEF